MADEQGVTIPPVFLLPSHAGQQAHIDDGIASRWRCVNHLG